MLWFNSRLSEKSLYWEPPLRDGYGDYKWSSPLEVDARWKDSGKSIRYDKNGAEVVSSSIVWVSDRKLLTGGYLMKGNLYSIENLYAPPLEEAFDIDNGQTISAEYARQIIDIETISAVYDKELTITKVWLR